MRRVKGKSRPAVPEHIVRLKDMCTLAEQHQAERACAPELHACYVCGAAEIDSRHGPHKCPICLLCAHEECLQLLMRAREYSCSGPVDVTGLALPSMLQTSTLCKLCTDKLKRE